MNYRNLTLTILACTFALGFQAKTMAQIFEFQISDFQQLQSFNVDLTQPTVLDIRITDGVFQIQGDVRVYEDAEFTQLNDIIRFVNVGKGPDAFANIAMATDVDSLCPDGIPSLPPKPDFIFNFWKEEILGTNALDDIITVESDNPICEKEVNVCQPNCTANYALNGETANLSLILFVLGDVNEDGMVSLLDVAPFVDLLNKGESLIQADINQDGSVDLLDVQPFIGLLAG